MRIVKPEIILVELTPEEYKTIRLALQHFEHCESHEFNDYGLACMSDLQTDFEMPVYTDEQELKR